MEEKINLRVDRDFGGILETTFKFFRQEWKGLIKTVVALTLPVAVIVTMLFGAWYYPVVAIVISGNPSDSQTAQLAALSLISPLAIVEFLLAVAGSIVGSVIFLLSASSYISLRANNVDCDITIDLVWQRVKSVFLRGLGYLGLGYLTLFAVGALLVLILGGSFLLDGSVPSTAAIGLAFFVILAVAVVSIVLTPSLILGFPVMCNEDLGPLDAVRRSWYLTKGFRFRAFGILFVMNMIQSTVIMVVAYVPLVVFAIFMGVLSSDPGGVQQYIIPMIVVGVLWAAILVFLGLCGSLLNEVTYSVQYFGLVEKKEGTQLIERIEQMETESGELPMPF